MVRSWHGRFGTWKVIIDGQIHYFRTMDEIKQHFKQMVKDECLSLMQKALRVMLNFIPTESGQLAAKIYSGSVYGVMDWKNQAVFQFKFNDPTEHVITIATGKNAGKQRKAVVKIKNPAHSNSKHRTDRAPDTTLNNPNVHLIGTKGSSYIYMRDDPLATANYASAIRQVLRDVIATAIARIMRKTYYVHYYIKVSKTQYGKDQYLNPSIPAQLRKTNVLKLLAKGVTTNVIDEYGTFLQLYNRP